MTFMHSVCSGNCNFQYLSGLRPNLNKPELSMEETLTVRRDYYYGKPKDVPLYNAPQGGMYLFAQGSEDSVKSKPYGPQFKKYIEDNGLGKVYEIDPVPNPQHNNRVGILFVWIINHEACRVWWHANVLAKWEAKQLAKPKITKSKIEKAVNK